MTALILSITQQMNLMNYNSLLIMRKKEFYCVGDSNVHLTKVANKEAIRRYANML